MTKDDIIRMALAAGIYHEYDSEGQWDGLTNETLVGKDWLSSKDHKLNRIVEILTPFAELVASAEREACARLCELMWHEWLDSPEENEPNKPDAEDCYRAIRARGQA